MSVSGSEVGYHRHDLLDAVLVRPVGDDDDGLSLGETPADDVGRTLGDDRGGRRHDDLRDLGFD